MVLNFIYFTYLIKQIILRLHSVETFKRRFKDIASVPFLFLHCTFSVMTIAVDRNDRCNPAVRVREVFSVVCLMHAGHCSVIAAVT